MALRASLFWQSLSIAPLPLSRTGRTELHTWKKVSFSDLPFLAFLVKKKQGKPPQKRSVLSSEPPKNSGQEGKKAAKEKDFLGKPKSKENPKRGKEDQG